MKMIISYFSLVVEGLMMRQTPRKVPNMASRLSDPHSAGHSQMMTTVQYFQQSSWCHFFMMMNPGSDKAYLRTLRHSTWSQNFILEFTLELCFVLSKK